MSVREDERQKNCSSRGLGVAAAAIGVGVGVGAALYYFFNKRAENPVGTGSTSEWESEHALNYSEDEDSYSTISEHTTTDTSIHSDIETSDESSSISSEVSYDEEDFNHFESDVSLYDGHFDMDVSEYDVQFDSDVNLSMDHSYNIASDEDIPNVNEWDVTASSEGIPMSESRSPVAEFFHGVANSTMRRFHRTSEQQKRTRARDKAFRQRTWTQEECSVCFETMQSSQELMSLPCTHRFHQSCILPWLQEQNTCPNCRKTTE